MGFASDNRRRGNAELLSLRTRGSRRNRTKRVALAAEPGRNERVFARRRASGDLRISRVAPPPEFRLAALPAQSGRCLSAARIFRSVGGSRRTRERLAVP